MQPVSAHDRLRLVILLDDDYEDLEFWYPKLRLTEWGAEVVAAGLPGKRQCRGKHGYPATPDCEVGALPSAEFHGIILPGGWAPDRLRRDPQVLELVRRFDRAGRLIAAVCHGGWIAISAGVVRGVRTTGSPGIRDDLVNAGAVWVDAPVVVDRHFVTSRRPDDLPDFCRGIVEVLNQQRAVPVHG